MTMRRAIGCTLLLILGLIGCASDKTAPAPAAWPAAMPAPDGGLQPLAFMAGSWFSVNPNGSANREHWTTPRGRTMTGTFQQVRKDGSPSVYELSAIEAAPDGKVTLHLRHLHPHLAIDDKRPVPEIYHLTETGPNRAVFTPSPDPTVPREKGVASITYRLDEQGRLVQEIRYEPGSPEKDYTGISTREPR